MQARMTETEKEGFKPIRIELILESEADVQSLWHRTNLSVEDVEVRSKKGAIIAGEADYPLWQLLDDIARGNSIPLFRS